MQDAHLNLTFSKGRKQALQTKESFGVEFILFVMSWISGCLVLDGDVLLFYISLSMEKKKLQSVPYRRAFPDL